MGVPEIPLYTSFIASNFNYCPLVCFFTSRESIDKIDKIQERALRFVLKDHISDYKNILLKSGFDSFRIYAVKCLMIELFKILEGITPNYLSDLFVKADTPYDTRDNKSAKGAYTWSSPVCLSMCEGSEYTRLSVTKRKIILNVTISKLLVLVSMSGIWFGVYINNISALV